jgi:hypothetical protein
MVKFDAELAALAQQSTALVDSIAQGGSFIKTQGGQLQYGGAVIPGNKMNVVVIDHILHNGDYDGAYDPSNPQPPACYAFGRTEAEMQPHEKSTDVRCQQCKGCPQNEFGSADTGRGKHCKNMVRLAVLAQSDLDDVANAEEAYMHVPPTSIKNWAGYVRQLGEVMKKPPLAVITEISLTPDPKSQFKVNFQLVEEVTDSEVLGQLIEKYKVVSKKIDFPYQEKQEAPAVPARGGRGRQQAAPAARGKAAPAARRKF